MKIILAAVIFMCSNAMADDLPDMGEPSQDFYGWSKKEIAKEAGFGVLMLVDYRQTMDIKRSCSPRQALAIGGTSPGPDPNAATDCDRYETNPFLGRRPSDARIRNYFLGAAAAHVLIVHLLPTEWRNAVQNGSIIFEGFVVGRNYHLGLSGKF